MLEVVSIAISMSSCGVAAAVVVETPYAAVAPAAVSATSAQHGQRLAPARPLQPAQHVPIVTLYPDAA